MQKALTTAVLVASAHAQTAAELNAANADSEWKKTTTVTVGGPKTSVTVTKTTETADPFANNETAVDAFANNETAVDAFANNETAVDAFANSENAEAWQTFTSSGAGTRRFNGDAFITQTSSAALQGKYDWAGYKTNFDKYDGDYDWTKGAYKWSDSGALGEGYDWNKWKAQIEAQTKSGTGLPFNMKEGFMGFHMSKGTLEWQQMLKKKEAQWQLEYNLALQAVKDAKAKMSAAKLESSSSSVQYTEVSKAKLISLQSEAKSARSEYMMSLETLKQARISEESAKSSFSSFSIQRGSEQKNVTFLQAQISAAKAKRKAELAWVQVLVVQKELDLKHLEAQKLIWMRWKESESRQMIASTRHSMIYSEQFSQAKRIYTEYLENSKTLLATKIASEKYAASAEEERQKARRLVLKLQQESADEQLKAEAELDLQKTQAIKNAADSANREIKEQQRINQAAQDQAQVDWTTAQVSAAMESAKNLAKKVAEAKQIMTLAKTTAEASLKAYKEKAAKKSLQVSARADGIAQAKYRMAIQTRKVEFSKARALLKAAKAKVDAAQIAWQQKYEMAKYNAMRSSDELKVKIMSRISQGAEAARIQAEAFQRAEILRNQAYAAAVKRGWIATMSVKIQKEAMQKASYLEISNALIAANADKKLYANRYKAIQAEAFSKYESKTSFTKKKETKVAIVVGLEASLTKVKSEVALQLAAVAKLELELELKEQANRDAQHQLEVSFEQMIRQKQASQEARNKAEAVARASATKTTQTIHVAALVRAEKISLQKMEIAKRRTALKLKYSSSESVSWKAQAAAARTEALRIQAEAKFRARVAAEAAHLHDEASRKLDLQFQMAVKAETDQRNLMLSIELKLKQKNQLYAARQQAVETLKAAAAIKTTETNSAEVAWKLEADNNAIAFATKIMKAAEKRARHQWEAASIQKLAIRRAEYIVTNTTAEAEKYKLKSFNFTLGAVEIEKRRVEAKRQLLDERSSRRWDLQIKTVREINFQSHVFKLACEANKTMSVDAEAKIVMLEGEKKDANAQLKTANADFAKISVQLAEAKGEISAIMLNNGSADNKKAATEKLEKVTQEAQDAEMEASNINIELQKTQKMLSAQRFDLVTAKKDAKSACIYAQAAKRAGATQGKALCVTKKNSYLAEGRLVQQLNHFEQAAYNATKASGKIATLLVYTPTPMPVKQVFPVENWQVCLGCSAAVKPVMVSKKQKTFTYPLDLTYNLGIISSSHSVAVKVVDGSRTMLVTSAENPPFGTPALQVTVEEEPNFPAYGSADVEIVNMNDCGMTSTPEKFIICDNEKTPGATHFAGPKEGTFQRDEVLSFDWTRPASYAGHWYELEWYPRPEECSMAPPKIPGVKTWWEIKGPDMHGTDIPASVIMAQMQVGETVVMREHALNRCRVMGPFGNYWVYEKRVCEQDKYTDTVGVCHELVFKEIWNHPKWAADKSVCMELIADAVKASVSEASSSSTVTKTITIGGGSTTTTTTAEVAVNGGIDITATEKIIKKGGLSIDVKKTEIILAPVPAAKVVVAAADKVEVSTSISTVTNEKGETVETTTTTTTTTDSDGNISTSISESEKITMKETVAEVIKENIEAVEAGEETPAEAVEAVEEAVEGEAADEGF